ncbi:lipoate--protein ligase [Lentimicrobium sp.]|jgi:lipoate-protein ligase A|uniref:lipoate--protein ligase n=1 Tax=Lentimicrobium sp. TaxID=2034841 RepID=UPI002C595073|nr:lipoate--protein ligase [Lentimicrobium sp.]MCO5262976.1 lipoate--protein ligase [Lentimicrobium sp.]HPF64468.1 lipoate--protein ligase [Lentimicrobium sp.]HPJ62860.1 lipoate--protein ligase [Lentimicrobium sp.]HPR26580.1 lipoate--protein ligase [Lentimicrobium sp.]HRW69764.1 lipoate--protein ligase [Lentimicrobium sp.]
MLCIIRHETDPYFNLAAEEYVLKNFERDSFMLWRNEPAIIVGKHQNTLAEINQDYVKENMIKVVRRLSGGGAVFHDLGNLNFTFIASGENHQLVDFRKFTQPILEVLQKLDIEARFEGRNDLTIDGRKFSGNAEHVHKNRVLHHGTLLFSAQMADLSSALKVDPDKFQDKAVKSVRSRVTNISEHLKIPLTVLEFRDLVLKHVMESTPGAELYSFTQDDITAISRLRDEKYITWEWNFGYSPKYNFRKTVKTNGGKLEVTLEVVNGTIEKARFFGDYFNKLDPSDIEHALTGTLHNETAIRERLNDFEITDYFLKIGREELITALF